MKEGCAFVLKELITSKGTRVTPYWWDGKGEVEVQDNTGGFFHTGKTAQSLEKAWEIAQEWAEKN